MRRPALMLFLVTMAVGRARAQQTNACPVPSIDSAQLLRDDSRLSADSMRGRYIGTPENAKARDFVAARFDALGLTPTAAGRILPFQVHAGGQDVAAFNVAGIVRGTNAPDQFIVVSAHFDHIGVAGHGQCRARNGDSICNGADDNASGTAAILALAEYFSRHPAAHSLLFVAFDAEEEGDLGSKAFVASPPLPLAQMLVDVNLDMVGRNVKHELYAAGPDKYPALRPLVEDAARCTSLHLVIGHDGSGGEDWTDQSDQGAFHRQHVPFIYLGEEDHPDYHQPGDELAHLMPDFFAAAARIAADLVRRVDAAPPPPR